MESAENLKLEFTSRILGKTQELTRLRKLSDLTQTDMAHKCGVSPSTIIRFETIKQENPYLVFCYEQIIKS